MYKLTLTNGEHKSKGKKYNVKELVEGVTQLLPSLDIVNALKRLDEGVVLKLSTLSGATFTIEKV